jgi:hypothetical protein
VRLLSLTDRIDGTNGALDRAIVRHVRWHVHATGTWKPPLAPENDRDTEDEEENGVSDCRLVLYLYTALEETRPHRAGRTAPTDTSATPPSFVCASFHNWLLANNLRLNFSSRLFWDVWTSCAPTGGVVPSHLRLRCRCHRPHPSLHPFKLPFSPFRFSRRRRRWRLRTTQSARRSDRTLFSTHFADRFHHLRWLGSPPAASRGGLGLTAYRRVRR